MVKKKINTFVWLFIALALLCLFGDYFLQVTAPITFRLGNAKLNAVYDRPPRITNKIW